MRLQTSLRSERSANESYRMTRYDVAIIGGGPAGLSAAVLLGRCRRKVIVFDHGKPRNYAAVEIHGYLGLDRVSPRQLRDAGRREAIKYGVEFVDGEANEVFACGDDDCDFQVRVDGREPIVS